MVVDSEGTLIDVAKGNFRSKEVVPFLDMPISSQSKGEYKQYIKVQCTDLTAST